MNHQIEEAAREIIEAASDRQDERFCRLLASWQPDFERIISKHLSSGWVKVTPETMPPNLTRYLVAFQYPDGGSNVMEGVYAGAGEWVDVTCDKLPGTVTHWQNIPSPPE
jgi:hypothetical protein